MILNSSELNTSDRSNAAVEEIVTTFKKETEAQEQIVAKPEKNLQRDRLSLGETYLRILEAGGHLGC